MTYELDFSVFKFICFFEVWPVLEFTKQPPVYSRQQQQATSNSYASNDSSSIPAIYQQPSPNATPYFTSPTNSSNASYPTTSSSSQQPQQHSYASYPSYPVTSSYPPQPPAGYSTSPNSYGHSTQISSPPPSLYGQPSSLPPYSGNSVQMPTPQVCGQQDKIADVFLFILRRNFFSMCLFSLYCFPHKFFSLFMHIFFLNTLHIKISIDNWCWRPLF
jgi:hypothetical protein